MRGRPSHFNQPKNKPTTAALLVLHHHHSHCLLPTLLKYDNPVYIDFLCIAWALSSVHSTMFEAAVMSGLALLACLFELHGPSTTTNRGYPPPPSTWTLYFIAAKTARGINIKHIRFIRVGNLNTSSLSPSFICEKEWRKTERLSFVDGRYINREGSTARSK